MPGGVWGPAISERFAIIAVGHSGKVRTADTQYATMLKTNVLASLG